ncbi:MAG: hypothetical protein M3245_04615, partial [Actinomycetota bacterium]|nr:hypothetical protein [Actinomycetota bacterium]
IGAMGLALGWERSHRRRAGLDRPGLRAMLQEGPGIVLAFAVVPFLVYLAAWAPWLADRGFDLGEWLRHHWDMAEFHRNLSSVNPDGEPIHPYMSPAWTWLLMTRPVAYYWNGGDGTAAEIIGIGHPLVFWGALIVIPYLAIRWRRDWAAGAVLVPILAQYLPWLPVARPLFLFYMTPVAPFLALGTVLALRDLTAGRARDRSFAVAAAALVVVVSVAVFAFFWPVLVGRTIPFASWQQRMWLPSWI